MNNLLPLLKNEESAVFALRSLYRKYGYLPYKMSKFEEYDLYLRNKDFLISDSIITFNDTNGKLMALKPDVTLSIVKNSSYEKGVTQKLFYNENVYRVSGSTHAYKEIMQTGLECIGDVSLYDIAEVLMLALESLEKIGGEFVLDVSHLGVISAIIDEAQTDEGFKKELLRLLGEKNSHEIKALCRQYGVSEEVCEKLTALVGLYGSKESVTAKLRALCKNEKMNQAVDEIEQLCDILCVCPLCEKINFDFSIVNNMNYYNGIVFKGYIDGIPESVLSGGQYDALMQKMGKKGSAVGFAVYLDLLEQLAERNDEYDVDLLILYDDSADLCAMARLIKEITDKGQTVSVQKSEPKNLRCKNKASFITGADAPLK